MVQAYFGLMVGTLRCYKGYFPENSPVVRTMFGTRSRLDLACNCLLTDLARREVRQASPCLHGPTAHWSAASPQAAAIFNCANPVRGRRRRAEKYRKQLC